MPRKSAAKRGFPVDLEDCYANRHLTGPEYKVYDVMLAFAISGRTSLHGKGSKEPLFFSASIKPTLVNALAMSVNQASRMKDRLLKLGWIVRVKKGERRATGQQAPDTYRIFIHEEYVAAHPGQCPPYEYAPNFETAQALGVRHGQRLREQDSLPKNFWPSEPVLRSAIDKLTTEDGASLFTDDETAAWNKHLENIKSRPQSVLTAQSPECGDGPEPQNGEGRTHNLVKAGTTKRVEPEPQNGQGRHPNPGENPIPSSGSPITFVQPTTTTATTASPPAWLSGLWSIIDGKVRFQEHERYGGLKLRKAKPANMADKDSVRVSADVAGVLDLIELHGEKLVKWTWACFAMNPMPHCQLPMLDGEINPKATLYPVSVFLEHFDAYNAAAKTTWKGYEENKDRPPEVTYYIREWNAENR